MSISYRVFTLFFLLFFQVFFSQKTKKEESALYKKASEAYDLAYTNSNSAMLLANKTLRESVKKNDQLAIANSYNSIGWIWQAKGSQDSAIHYLQKSYNLFEKLHEYESIVRVGLNLSEAYTKQIHYNDALKVLIKVDSLATDIGWKRGIAAIERQMGVVYRETGDYGKSTEYFNKALDKFREQKDWLRIVTTSNSLSILYLTMKKPDSTIAVCDRSLKIIKQNNLGEYQEAMANESMADAYYEKHNFQKALEHYTKAYHLFEILDNKGDVAFEAFSVGKTLRKLKQNKQAEKYLLRSYHLNDSLNLRSYQLDASSELALIYQETGDWKNAFRYLQKSSELKDSIDFSDQIAQTKELKEKFETEKKEKEIKLLATEKELQQQKLSRQRIFTISSLGFIVLLLVSIGLLINRNRWKQRMKEMQLRNEIAADLHDEVGSSISSIQMLSQMASVQNDINHADLLGKIETNSKETMEKMSDILWMIKPGKTEGYNLAQRMEQFAYTICEAKNIKLKMELDIPQDLKLSLSQRKSIYLIFKEAVNNVAKYSESNVLYVNARKDSGKFTLEIKDTGKGFNLENTKNGNGLDNMKKRAEDAGGNLEIQSEIGHGTTVMMSLLLKN